ALEVGLIRRGGAGGEDPRFELAEFGLEVGHALARSGGKLCPRATHAVKPAGVAVPERTSGTIGPAKAARGSGQRGFRLAHDRLERRRLADGKIGQHLAIDHDPGLAEAGDKSAVSQPERAHRRIEPLNPQRAKAALFALAVPVGVLLRALDRLLGDPNGILAAAVIALGRFQDLLVLGMRGDASLDAGHGSLHRKFWPFSRKASIL